MPVRAYIKPIEPVPTFGFLNILSQKRAKVQDGNIYGNIKALDINFFPFILLLVISHATLPPKISANIADKVARSIEFSIGL